MTSLFTIILFFMYIYGLGYGSTYFLVKPKNFLEKNIMRLGIGLGILPILLVILSILKIPLDWRVILLLSVLPLIVSLSILYKNGRIKLKSIKVKKSDLYILIVIIIFLATSFMYIKGAFNYPYLEDDDSWNHANGVKYVSIMKTVFNPNGGTSYLDPYPPAYDGILGLLHETSPSLYWTMKFFNALIISLSILFFYLFAKEFIGNKKKALFSTFVLASIPCYLSHFIWSHSLIPPLIILAFYSFEMIKSDKKYSIISTLLVSSIFVTQPSQAIKFAIMFTIYLIVNFFYYKKEYLYHLGSFIAGGLLSLTWWATRWREQFFNSYNIGFTDIKVQASQSISEKVFNITKAILNNFSPASGSATRAYNLGDFFLAKHQNMINNPTGIGIFICLTLLAGFLVLIFYLYKSLKSNQNLHRWKIIVGRIFLGLSIFLLVSGIIFKSLLMFSYLMLDLIIITFVFQDFEKKENKGWILITLAWMLFTYIGINSLTFNLPIGLFAFRFWMLFAIPVSLFSAIGAEFILNLFRRSKITYIIVFFLLVSSIILTSAHQKFSVNTAQWPPGAFWTSYEEIEGALYLKTLGYNNKIFTFSHPGVVNGNDQFFCVWCEEDRNFRKIGFNETAEENYGWLKDKNYDYIILDGLTANTLGFNETNNKINSFISSGLFRVVHQTQGFILFKLN